ncbi:amidohydrolase family protein [Bradyrhizobium sp. NP1]|uniref:amidohydrolase family protein n=1 Tax=Bradyrhizobium sp. NP1 TaxID=3049772 RepID=UPI0025A585A7|nr:amidohydrolase family protein [Bradyrhizobium sp. NP1]WJR77265.1 amidohydrolase family protein [Bradyrhizobium sp. NP1]
MKRTLITNGCIISMDPAIGDLATGDILIVGDRIAEIAPRIDAKADETIDAGGQIVLPGLINAHIHSWQTALRGLGGDWAGSDYFNFFHQTLAPRYAPEDTYIGTLVGALAQIDAGVTTIFDWCHNNATPAHTDAAIDALFESGIRALFGHGTVKPKQKPGEPHFSQVPHPVAEIARLRKQRLSGDDGLVTLAMAILGPDYSTIEVCRQDFRLAREFDLLTSAHVWGRPNRLVSGGYRTLAGEGLLGEDHNLVHGNYIADDELKVIVDHGASVTSTAAVELHFHVSEPLTGRVKRMGGFPSIAIDSEVAARGDMFDVMRFALRAQRLFDNQATVKRMEADGSASEFARRNQPVGTGGSPISQVSVKTREALEWATLNNAKAMRLDHRIGTLTPGKQADLILIRTDRPHMVSAQDPVQAVVYYAQGSDVDTVLIGGRIVKRDGHLLCDRWDQHKAQLQASAKRLLDHDPMR